MRPHEAAVAVLRETDNPAVMWGDCGLLDQIAERLGWPWRAGPRGITQRHTRVLNALSRDPGALVAGTTRIPYRNRRVRIFWLAEHAPEHGGQTKT